MPLVTPQHAVAVGPPAPDRLKVVACATVIEAMAASMPAAVRREVLDFGLHTHPGRLTEALQARIDASTDVDAIVLGYGLCSGAVVGLRATHCRLVVPLADDCIAMFLGSQAAYRAESRGEPGTYYLTRGWIEVGDSPFWEVDKLAERFGPARAERIVRAMLRNYTRLAMIRTGGDDDGVLDRARAAAARFGLRFEELEGSPSLIEKLLRGPWDADVLVVEQGDTIRLESFMPAPRAGSPVA